MSDWRDEAEIFTETGGQDVVVLESLKEEIKCITCKIQLDTGDRIHSMPAMADCKAVIHRQHIDCDEAAADKLEYENNNTDDSNEYDSGKYDADEYDDEDDDTISILVIESLPGGTRCVTCKNELVTRELIEIQPTVIHDVPLLKYRHAVNCPPKNGVK